MVRQFGRLAAVAVLVAAVGSPARAAFFDNFDGDALGLSVTSTTNFVVTNAGSGGNVDVIGPGLFDLLPGNGHYIDLDGTAEVVPSAAAVFRTKAGIGDMLLGPGNYVLTFDLAGSQRGDSNSVTVSVGTDATPAAFASQMYTVASADPFTTRSIAFTVAALTDVRLTFVNDGTDNVGALLDNVSVDVTESNPVPEPASLTLAAAGLLGLAARARRRAAK